ATKSRNVLTFAISGISSLCLSVSPSLRLFEILLRRGEPITDQRLDAHVGVGIAVVPLAAVVALDVFDQRELDPGDGALEEKVVGLTAAPAVLVDRVLSAVWVGGAVEVVDGGDAAGELVVPGHGVGVGDVLDADLGGDGLARLVHASRDAGVRVAIDEAGGDVLAAGVDDPGAGVGLVGAGLGVV